MKAPRDVFYFLFHDGNIENLTLVADFNFSFMGMDAKEQEMRLTRFERDLTAGKDICCLEGEVKAFPKILCKPFLMNYVGLIVCEKDISVSM